MPVRVAVFDCRRVDSLLDLKLKVLGHGCCMKVVGADKCKPKVTLFTCSNMLQIKSQLCKLGETRVHAPSTAWNLRRAPNNRAVLKPFATDGVLRKHEAAKAANKPWWQLPSAIRPLG